MKAMNKGTELSSSIRNADEKFPCDSCTHVANKSGSLQAHKEAKHFTKQFTQAKKCTLADGARSRAIPNPILTPMKGVTLGKNPFNASNAKRSSSTHGPSDAITLKSTQG